MAKKDFKKNPALFYIGEPEAPAEDPEEVKEDPEIDQGLTVPKGYILTREAKSERMQLLIRPSLKKGIKEAAAAQGLSMNDLINSILEEYLRKGV